MIYNSSTGLVHRSQISQAKVDDPSEVLTVGENVHCKVISIEVRMLYILNEETIMLKQLLL